MTRIHARNKPIDDSVDFKTLAKITVGFTGADIENMLNEAAILAARAGRPEIIMSDIYTVIKIHIVFEYILDIVYILSLDLIYILKLSP